MPLYNVGQTVYATKELSTSATGDHPAFLHARAGNALVVLEYRANQEFPYLVADNPEGREAFYAKSIELMGQKPFAHNIDNYSWYNGL